jgi:TfoX/Sxy family transcriptional regulator of competence genes
MAYDEDLGNRIKAVLEETTAFEEKKLFGGVGYMIRGNMACGVHKHMLVVRLEKEQYDRDIQLPTTKPFDITGREMRGWMLVNSQGVQKEADLRHWVQTGVEFAMTLPPK